MKTTKNKAFAIAIILALSMVVFCFQACLASSRSVQISETAIQNAYGNVSIEEHKVTATELAKLKAIVGTAQENQTYNDIVNGHGTGLSPPSEEEWVGIAENMQVINKISYQSIPSAVDNSETPWFPPIGNQDGQGSCTAWAVGYYTKTYQEAKEHSWDLSGATWDGGYYGYPNSAYQDNVMSPAFIYHLVNGGVDEGSSFEETINLISNIGVCSWQSMPYNPLDDSTWPSEAAWTEAPLYRGNSSHGYEYLYANNDEGISSLKSWLAAGNLAVIAVDANEYDDLTSADIWTSDRYQTAQLNHANTIVGYDDTITYTENGTTHAGAFKIANSWGTTSSWENVHDGFYWISYETMKELSTLYENPCMLFKDLVDYQPEILASFRISHNIRSDCRITVGLGTPASPITTKKFHDFVFGGAYPFCSNNIVLDITEFKSYMTSLYNQPFYMRVFDKGATNGGTLTTGRIMFFGVETASSTQTPVDTINNAYVNLAVTSSLASATLNLSPTTGPPNGIIALSGVGFTAGSSVNVSYLHPLNGTWVTVIDNLPTVECNFTYTINAPDLLQSSPAGDNPPASKTIVFSVIDNSNGNSYNSTYTEYSRGLSQVGMVSPQGLFGNGTDLASTVFVINGQSLPIVGRWFSPVAASIFWDNTNMGTIVIDETGYFNTSITVPNSSLGQHTLTINDGFSNFYVYLTQAGTTANDCADIWHTSDFTITLTPDSPVNETYYRINGGNICYITANGQPAITSEAATNTLEYWSTWNTSATSTVELAHVTLTGIKLDKTSPTGSISTSPVTTSRSITLALSASDATSGIAQMRFSDDGNSWSDWEVYATSKAWTLPSGQGAKTVYVEYSDNAGLTSMPYSYIVTLQTPQATSSPQVTSTPTATVIPTAPPTATAQPLTTPTVPEFNAVMVLGLLALSTLSIAVVLKRQK